MKQFDRMTRVVFIILQLLLYAAFLILDFVGNDWQISVYIKYTMILICFCYALLPWCNNDKSILYCIRIALLFTLISDLFLLILDIYFYGVFTFIIVQQIYSIRISLSGNPVGSVNRRQSVTHRYLSVFMLQLVITLIIWFVLSRLRIRMDKLLITSVFYFICIVMNTVRAVRAAFAPESDRGIRLFALGMVLFLLCDISVGLYNLSGFTEFSLKNYPLVYFVVSISMWLFYAPSQILIVLSSKVNICQNVQKND